MRRVVALDVTLDGVTESIDIIVDESSRDGLERAVAESKEAAMTRLNAALEARSSGEDIARATTEASESEASMET